MTECSERQSGTEKRGWIHVRSNENESGHKRREEEKKKKDKERQSEKKEPGSERAGRERGVRKEKGTAGTRSRNEQ